MVPKVAMENWQEMEKQRKLLSPPRVGGAGEEGAHYPNRARTTGVPGGDQRDPGSENS